MTEQEINQAAKAYRDYREECGYRDPVALDEIESAYYNGMLKMKEQMMKDAVEGHIAPCEDGKCLISDSLQAKIDQYKFGDHVKLVIIKED